VSGRYAFIMAGGMGSRLCLLSEKRAKPAVPFGGKYRIIDFTLSNCVNSGIFDIGVLTQYRPTSLNQHIGTGRPWDLDRTRGGVQVLQPALGSIESDWYRGTADAIYRNLIHLRRRRCDEVLVLSGDHVYAMDYNVLYAYHRAKGATLTVGVTEVPEAEISSFGILEVDPAGRIVGFKEKPRSARSRLANMGVYLFDRASLTRWLQEDASDADSQRDFGKNLLPKLVARGEAVYAYTFRDYWQDVGTLDSFYAANMAFLSDEPPLRFDDPSWVIHTQSADRPPVRLARGATIRRSLIANGAHVEGRVERSVLSPGVFVARDAVVTDSIVMHDVRIESGAHVDRAIVDKEVRVGRGAVVGDGSGDVPNQACPEHLSSGLTLLGKGVRLPEGITIGRNARIGAQVTEDAFTADVPAGGVVKGPGAMH